MKKRKDFSTHYMSLAVLLSKSDKVIINKRKLQTNSFMKVDVKILKILANWMQWYVKVITHHDQVEFISGRNDIWKSINGIHHTKRLKKKNYVIITIGVKKVLEELQHLFLIKTSSKLVREGKFLKPDKGYLWKTYSWNHM